MNLRNKYTVWAAAIAVASILPYVQESAAQQPPTAGAAARPRSTVGSQGPLPEHAEFKTEQVEAGGNLFISNCAFCHGKDAGGGESGPDLTRSKLVVGDKSGEAIGAVVRNGRPEKGMPRFALSDSEIVNLVAFIHSQQDKAMSQSGNRKGVDESDLQTGNAEAGKRYFEGAGGCTTCHSPAGDLAHVATKLAGLPLLQEMLYPKNVKPRVTVNAPGHTYSGTLEYRDEFHIGVKDSSGTYRSWPVSAITFQVNDPLEKHVDIMSRYTDKDMHDVLAYIETMK